MLIRISKQLVSPESAPQILMYNLLLLQYGTEPKDSKSKNRLTCEWYATHAARTRKREQRNLNEGRGQRT